MRSGSLTSPKSRSYLARGVAIFFVLFVVFDIATPQLCAETFSLHSGGAQSFAGGISDGVTDLPVADAGSNDSRQPEPSDPVPHEGDCLGCCPHVLSATSLKVDVLEITSLQVQMTNDQVLTPPLQRLFHPPRLA